MNTSSVMQSLYEVKARFDALAKQLEQAGYRMAAEELKREAGKFGCQLTQLESVCDDYRIEISTAYVISEKGSFKASKYLATLDAATRREVMKREAYDYWKRLENKRREEFFGEQR
ncbi:MULTISPECIES: hypothetical protein [unclassified Halomonas]|uniref:hypothetical protein n=1 Tax=unclassified Halomonas TaxID=2609666 RepID=UPI001CF22E23|nr:MULTISPECIES: hypothetical protein [unclassified Halomonas]MCA8865576.1 hypothetical protein [Halomonas sp. SBBP1]UZH10434.1 hypothetical protein OM794_01320 [Halomonas sp. BDJS001]